MANSQEDPGLDNLPIPPGQVTPDRPDSPPGPDSPDSPPGPDSPDSPPSPPGPDSPDSPPSPPGPDSPDSPPSPPGPDSPDSPPSPPGPDSPDSNPSPPSPPGPDSPDSPLPVPNHLHLDLVLDMNPLRTKKNVAVPYNTTLLNGVHDKLLITIVGTIKPNANKVTVDLSTSHDLAFHFNPRFNDEGKKVIVRNSCISKKWGKEERDLSGNFPFVPGQRFEMKIMCTNKEYGVAVNGKHMLTYQHRVSNLKLINKLNIYNDLTLSDVRMEKIP